MKTLLLILICVICTLSTGTGIYLSKKCNHQPVDLPEEYIEISHDHNNPNTLLGFYRNNTLYIQYK